MDKKADSRLLDFDEEKNGVVSLTYKGLKKSFTRDEIVRLIELANKVTVYKVATPQTGMSLLSVGKVIGNLLSTGGKDFTTAQLLKATKALEAFDGNTNQKRPTSQLWYMLQKILKWNIPKSNHSEELKQFFIKANEFLKKYPELKEIPKK